MKWQHRLCCGIGEFIDFAESRKITTDTPEDVVTYAAATLAIKEVIRGDIADAQLPIEFPLTQPANQVEETIANLATQLPSGDMLLFLRHKGGEESGLYRLTARDYSSKQKPMALQHHSQKKFSQTTNQEQFMMHRTIITQ
ncbi:MAG: hypothetical protein GFH27_549305n151 [Chloroflexi bacterium AL-W]|nr:hypothetical protein [Chloroflexi bacterium AL-N1]NOK69397.1 hypothetical protein [Chloroflexi bacterium AL-N10]NOK76458.1 hypothetical protein [Chloroflexi bacterium AL-N5]NOK83575.1 hypothetical protein [Chloroflexi bacterium AL-W]NOK91235.1 hypothetical protein [Chloroflexi bacterium AL-N15]